MRRLVFIPLLIAALLAGGAAFAAPGEAEVIVTDGRLTVSAQDTAIGNILSAIGLQAGFEIAVSPDVAQKTLSTQFTDLDIQKGIERLLTLINHKDYFIYYGKDGGISKVEVHGAQENTGPASQNPRRPNLRNTSPVNNRRIRPPTRRTPRPVPSAPNRINAPPVTAPPIPGDTGVSPSRGFVRPGMPPMPVNPIDDEEPNGLIQQVPPVPDNKGSSPYIPPTRMPAYIPPKNQN